MAYEVEFFLLPSSLFSVLTIFSGACLAQSPNPYRTPTVSPETALTIDTVQGQVDSTVSKDHEDFRTRRNDIKDVGGQMISRLARKQDQKVNYMQSAYWTDPHGNQIPLYSGQQIQNVNQFYNTKIDNQQLITRQALSSNHTAFVNRAQQLQQSADGIQTQLQQTKTLGDDAQLVTTGTNLYVRNYGQ